MVQRSSASSEEKSGNQYVYLDQAAKDVSDAIGLDISEKHVEQISNKVGVPVFKIGTRKAFVRQNFQNSFESFVNTSVRDLKAQTTNRQKGANTFNKKIDAMFSYFEYAESKGQEFSYRSCLTFLRAYDQDFFGSWSEETLKVFIKSRGARNENASNDRAKNAIATLESLAKNMKQEPSSE